MFRRTPKRIRARDAAIPRPAAPAADVAPREAAGTLLSARGIHKLYGRFAALRGVDLDLHQGEVNILIGANGAGKSTLMRILAGVEKPSAGELFLRGEAVAFSSSQQASRAGIAMVHQELSLLPNMSVAENIFAGRELHRRFFVRSGRQEEASRSALGLLGQTIDPRTLVRDLPLGMRQLVEIARALGQNADLLILDEPTSALSAAEVEILFGVLAELKSRGITVVYISHRIDELLRIGDHFTVLREGLVSGKGARSEVHADWICECMTGEPATVGERRPGPGGEREDAVRARGVCLDGPIRPILSGVSLSLARGEIVGLFGLLASGTSELLETLAGLQSRATGVIEIDGSQAKFRSPRDAMKLGIVYLSGDRKLGGVMELTVRENITLGVDQGARYGFVSRRKEAALVRDSVSRLRMSVHDLEQPLRSLSGGNQQKALLARSLLLRPRLLLMDDPTRGVDIQSKNEIHSSLRELAQQGLTILFSSSEIEELKAFAGRVLVMNRGAVAAEFRGEEITEAALLPAASMETPPVACHV